MSKFSKFLRKYSDEIGTVASAFGLLARLLPVGPADRIAISNAVTSLTAASESVAKSIKDVEKLGDVKINKADIKAAVKELMPDLIGGLIEAAVRKAVEEQAKALADQTNSS